MARRCKRIVSLFCDFLPFFLGFCLQFWRVSSFGTPVALGSMGGWPVRGEPSLGDDYEFLRYQTCSTFDGNHHARN